MKSVTFMGEEASCIFSLSYFFCVFRSDTSRQSTLHVDGVLPLCVSTYVLKSHVVLCGEFIGYILCQSLYLIATCSRRTGQEALKHRGNTKLGWLLDVFRTAAGEESSLKIFHAVFRSFDLKYWGYQCIVNTKLLVDGAIFLNVNISMIFQVKDPSISRKQREEEWWDIISGQLCVSDPLISQISWKLCGKFPASVSRGNWTQTWYKCPNFS